MKTFLIVNAIITCVALIKIKLVGYEVKRRFIKPKSDKRLFERFLELVYSLIMLFIPPINIIIIFYNTETLANKIGEAYVKRNA